MNTQKEIVVKGLCGKIFLDNDLFEGNKRIFNGVDAGDNFVDYLGNKEIAEKLDSGYMEFHYDNDSDQLYTVTRYYVKEDLTEEEIKELVDYTQGQWSDGIGEGFEQNPCMEVDGKEVYISPWYMGQDVIVEILNK